MVKYTYHSDHFGTGLQVGEPVNIGSKKVVVITILEVDFVSGTVEFMGMDVSEIRE